MYIESRRSFLKSSFLTTAILLMHSGKVFGAVTPLQTLSLVQEDLFPQAKLLKSNVNAYTSLIFQHSRVNDEDKTFLRNGIGWLNEESISHYKKIYTELTLQERQNLLKIISKQRWGENWITTVLTYIMEAMLGDPIYGINRDGSGWKWLNYESGLPRPKGAFL